MVTRLLKSLLFVACLFSLSFAKAQTGNYIPGYGYLGSCNDQYGRPHYYYISIDENTLVKTVKLWPDAKAAAISLGGYLTTLTSQAENDCVYGNLVKFYTVTHPSIGLVPLTNPSCVDPTNDPLYRPCSPWNDDRHPWIGYTDAVSEGTTESNFIFTNGESACNTFNNWDAGEPNNFGPPPGEDYVQLLAYVPHGNPPANQVGGKWNDWFNSETQTYIVEFGPSSCTPPANRGNSGCSHGYWKNAKDKAWTDAGYNRTSSFTTTFGITNNRGVVTASTTLQQSLELNGGGYNQVAKQGTAALLNAARGFYPYTPAEIKTAVQSMFNNGTATLPSVTVNGTTYTGGTWNTPQGLADYLDMLNNLGCPLNNAGNMGSISARQTPLTEGSTGLSIRALSNPANGFFNVQVGTSSTEKLTLKVMDMQGKLIENRPNISANQNLIFGNSYRPGVYFIEVIQGAERKQMKLVKAN